LSAGVVLFATSLYLSAGVLLHATTPRRTVLREAPQTGPSPSSGFEQSREGRGPGLPPAIHPIPGQSGFQLSTGAPQRRNQEPPSTASATDDHGPSPTALTIDDDAPPPTIPAVDAPSPTAPAVDTPPPTGPVVNTPPPAAYAYDVIAATEEERRAADEVSKEFHADEEKIFAQMRSGELDKKDVKPALLKRVQTETESLIEIVGADRAAKLREAEGRPGG
jgi:hypothetical protein